MSDTIIIKDPVIEVVEVSTPGPQGPQGPQGDPGPDPLTTKGDLMTRDATDTIRFGVGADDEVLTADAAAAEGMKWAPVPGGGGAPALASVSLLTLTNSLGFGVEANPWLDTNHPSFVEDTDWEHNLAAVGVVYTPSTGEFSVNADGSYMISVSVVAQQDGASLTFVDVRLRVNGVQKFISKLIVHGAVDPIALPINIILALGAGDDVTVTIEPINLAIFFNAGSVFNIHKVG